MAGQFSFTTFYDAPKWKPIHKYNSFNQRGICQSHQSHKLTSSEYGIHIAINAYFSRYEDVYLSLSIHLRCSHED